jgi:hypothetical protein
MDIAWKITSRDIAAVRAVVAAHRGNAMVRNRVRRNLAKRKPSVSRAKVWRALVGSLLTTQQRSGPQSAVARFMNSHPFPLGYRVVKGQRSPEKFFRAILTGFGGIRRNVKIAAELSVNLQRLEAGLWPTTVHQINRLRNCPPREVEVEVADFLDEQFVGLGPKQARNLLQGLGLTRFEIPIDSRITKWLNRTGFPVHLSAGALADISYYKFIMQGVHELCRRSGVYPCVLDAAVFASFDGEGWTDDNVGW